MLQKLISYIHHNLDKGLALEELASVGNYSPHHFHRVFKKQVGETPKAYMLRLQLEKASKELVSFPGKSIYGIAIDSGFSSQSAFARAFKKKYGKSASTYREERLKELRMVTQQSVRIVEVEKMAGCWVVGELTYLEKEENITGAFKKIITWGLARDLIDSFSSVCGVFLDSTVITSLRKCRYIAGIITKECISVLNKVTLRLCDGKYAKTLTLGSVSIMLQNSLSMKMQWVPVNGYQIRSDDLGFEKLPVAAADSPYHLQHREFYLPVKPY